MNEQPAIKPRKERTYWKALRLTAYIATVGLLAGGLAMGSAYGSMKDAALSLGSELGKLEGAGSQTPIRLNGQPIHVSSTVADVPLRELLDRVEARCQDNSESLKQEISQLPEPMREKLLSQRASGAIRREAPGKGMVACFMREGETGGLATRFKQISQFLDTGDLSKLGNLRYVYAEKTDEGLTHVVTAWTDGPFNLYHLLPANGDTPGSDPEDAPRPTNSTRLLTATIDGVPYSVRIYDSSDSPEAVVTKYDEDMTGRGWKILIQGMKDAKGSQRVYSRAGIETYVFPRVDKGHTLVTVIQTRGLP